MPSLCPAPEDWAVAIPCTTKYPPFIFMAAVAVVSQTRVSAPCSGLNRPLLRLKPLATRPGWKQLAVTSVPSSRRPEFARGQDVGELGLSVSPKTAIEALGVQVVEGDVRALVGLGCRGDDASQGARLQPFEEKCRKQEWCQLIDRPGQLDTVLAQLPGSCTWRRRCSRALTVSLQNCSRAPATVQRSCGRRQHSSGNHDRLVGSG